MKKFLVTVLICTFVIVLFSLTAKTQSPITHSSIIGTWKTIEDEAPNKGKASSYIEIFEMNGVVFGKITKLLIDPPDKICDKCKGDLKNKPVIGMLILKDMKKTGNVDEELGSEYTGGTIMDPGKGDIYKCKIWFKDDVLTVRGYIGVSLFGRSQKWFRVK